MVLYVILFLSLLNPVIVQAAGSISDPAAVVIPGGEGGIGFDDLMYSPQLHKVLVPAGHTGKLYLIDPDSNVMTSIGGFSSGAVFEKGHRAGITSADEGDGFIFVADHGRHVLAAIDAKTGSLADTADLSGDVDILRYVAVNHEVWATEPDLKQIEVFKMTEGEHHLLKALQVIPFQEGPEGLIIDHRRGLAYTNVKDEAVSIGLDSHAISAAWPNTCEKSRVDALDEGRGFLFVACGEGKAVVFDLNNGHKVLSSLVTDPAPDVISYNTRLGHLYFTSSRKATLSVIGVSSRGWLSMLGQSPADKRSHCVVSDGQNNVWVCDPPRGRLLRYKDSL